MVDGIVYIYTNKLHQLCRQPPTHQTNVPMTDEPTNQPTTKKRALLEKLTDTSSHINMVCWRRGEGGGTCPLEFAKVGTAYCKKVYRNTATNILLLRSWF